MEWEGAQDRDRQILRLASTFARQWWSVSDIIWFMNTCICHLLIYDDHTDGHTDTIPLLNTTCTWSNSQTWSHECSLKGGSTVHALADFGIRIGRRKHPNEYTPFTSVSLWNEEYFHLPYCPARDCIPLCLQGLCQSPYSMPQHDMNVS